MSGYMSITLSLLFATSVACSTNVSLLHSDAVAAQEAAVEFLARQNSVAPAPLVCVRVASGPGEMVEGRVAKHLQDPPATVLDRLRAKGLAVEAFSGCKPDDRAGLVLSIGWPTRAPEGAEVSADRLCGFDCGGGFRVHVLKTGERWRATGATPTWIS